MDMRSLKKYLYIVVGSIALTLGVIGIFIPVLPTTPFLLLASYCYLRGSNRMYHWLMNHKILGAYIYSYMTYKAVPKKTKISAIIFLWASLTFSMVIVSSLHLRILLAVIGTAVTFHLMTLRTLSREEMKAFSERYRREGKDPTLSDEK
jgi:hypothetical protein